MPKKQQPQNENEEVKKDSQDQDDTLRGPQGASGDEVQDEQLSPLEKCEKERDEYLDGWKRAQAELANFKTRAEKEKMEAIKYSNGMLLQDLLPILNNFEQAFSFLKDGDDNTPLGQGMVYIQKQFEDFLKGIGVSKIETVGNKFDPSLHEALKEDEDGEEGMIVTELQPGYMLHDKVIMPSKVVVGRKSSDAKEESGDRKEV